MYGCMEEREGHFSNADLTNYQPHEHLDKWTNSEKRHWFHLKYSCLTVRLDALEASKVKYCNNSLCVRTQEVMWSPGYECDLVRKTGGF